SCRRRQLLRHIRRAEDLRAVLGERARDHAAQLRERLLLDARRRHGYGQDGARRREHASVALRDEGAPSAPRGAASAARVQRAGGRTAPHRLDEGGLNRAGRGEARHVTRAHAVWPFLLVLLSVSFAANARADLASESEELTRRWASAGFRTVRLPPVFLEHGR